MKSQDIDSFPLSRERKKKGSRRLVREKSLQILSSYFVSESDLDRIFSHIFFRDFNFGDNEKKADKLLTPDEIYEMEADVPIVWKEEEIDFGRELLRHTIAHHLEIDAIIDEICPNWELDRISYLDRIIIQMAAAELVEFPEIPTKVTINEAIDIAKIYSTEKSGTFINGLLDTILERMKTEGKIKKTGRGLIDE